ETLEHVVLRVLAWCLFYQEGITFGPGLSSSDTADLWVHDLTGRLTTWIECGTARFEHLRRAIHANAGAKVHALFSNPRRRTEIALSPESKPPPRRTPRPPSRRVEVHSHTFPARSTMPSAFAVSG